MTSDEDLREILRDVAVATRDNGRRIDGLSSRMDDFVAELGEVKLQTALTAGHTVELKAQLAALDTASWEETARHMRRVKSIGTFIRRRGVGFSLLVLTGAGGAELLRSILH